LVVAHDGRGIGGRRLAREVAGDEAIQRRGRAGRWGDADLQGDAGVIVRRVVDLLQSDRVRGGVDLGIGVGAGGEPGRVRIDAVDGQGRGGGGEIAKDMVEGAVFHHKEDDRFDIGQWHLLVLQGQASMFFSEEKNQKTFTSGVHG
jgi:hypothetical protein